MCSVFLREKPIGSPAEKAQWTTKIGARCLKQITHGADKNTVRKITAGHNSIGF